MKLKKEKKITDAQIYALLKSTNNMLTIDKLASATQTNKAIAKEKLNSLVVDSILESRVDDLDVVYFTPDIKLLPK